MDCSKPTEPEGWRQLTLDQQIERWKVETERAYWEIPAERPLGWVKLYEKGVVTKMVFDCEVLSSIRETNVAEFLNRCPADVLSELVAILTELPRDTDEDWPRWGGGGDPRYAPWCSREFIDAISDIDFSERDRSRGYREGVRVLRHSLKQQVNQE